MPHWYFVTLSTHLPLHKMVAISQTMFSYVLSWRKGFPFWLKLHWSFFFKGPKLIVTQHWFRYWLGAEWATSHHLDQCSPDSLKHICANGGWVNEQFRNLWRTETLILFSVTVSPKLRLYMFIHMESDTHAAYLSKWQLSIYHLYPHPLLPLVNIVYLHNYWNFSCLWLILSVLWVLMEAITVITWYVYVYVPRLSGSLEYGWIPGDMQNQVLWSCHL